MLNIYIYVPVEHVSVVCFTIQAKPANPSSSSNIGAFDGACMCVCHTTICRYYQLFFLRLMFDVCSCL